MLIFAADGTSGTALYRSDGTDAGTVKISDFGRGSNGVMIDIARLPIIDAFLGVSDFDFGPAGAPVSVSVRPRAGVNGSDRVTLIWRDYHPLDASPLPQAVANGWLTITIRANTHTGLAAPDVFSFGKLVGEAGDGSGAAGWRVSAVDLGAVKKALDAAATLAAAADFNRDGRVNALDLALVKQNLNRSLSMPVLTAAPIVRATGDAAVPDRVADEILRRASDGRSLRHLSVAPTAAPTLK